MKDGDIRELLELAARAMGYKKSNAPLLKGLNMYVDTRGEARMWEPDADSGDCAEMCAALGIGTQWVGAWVECSHGESFVTEEFGDDRAAAWRTAALRVASEIGRGRE